MKLRIILPVLCCGLLLTSAPALAQGKGKGREAGKGAPAFGAGERETIRGFFADGRNLEGLPPGLARREELPPGLRKHLEKNGTLPPGLQKKVRPLPQSLESRLPPVGDNLKRAVIGSAVVLLEKGTNKILDLIEDVVPR